jgi:hypothetical protein
MLMLTWKPLRSWSFLESPYAGMTDTASPRGAQPSVIFSIHQALPCAHCSHHLLPRYNYVAKCEAQAHLRSLKRDLPKNLVHFTCPPALPSEPLPDIGDAAYVLPWYWFDCRCRLYTLQQIQWQSNALNQLLLMFVTAQGLKLPTLAAVDLFPTTDVHFDIAG